MSDTEETLQETPADVSSGRPTLIPVLIKIGLALLLIIALAGLFTPVDRRSRKASDRTEALNNARQIGLSLSEFAETYDHFPDATTIARVKADTSTPLSLDDNSSNKLFRQLIATSLKSEMPFWAKTKISPKKPDGVYNGDDKALMPGECGFSYVAGLSPDGDPATPIAVTPMIPGTTTFDPEIYQGKAVVLFLDYSAKSLPLDEAGHAILNGMDIFDPRQPFWKGKTPNIKWPEPR